MRVCTPARVAGWPRTARTDLGRLTATGGLPYAPDDLKALLDDPEVAVGYAHGALTKPKDLKSAQAARAAADERDWERDISERAAAERDERAGLLAALFDERRTWVPRRRGWLRRRRGWPRP